MPDLSDKRPELKRPDQRRYSVALRAVDRTVGSVAREADLSERYVFQALGGRCPLSDRMIAALRHAVGEDGWRYACGLTDVLPCPPAAEGEAARR